MSFFERYQLLTTGLIGLVTALGLGALFFAFKVRQKRDELRSIAAALRGELMAARSVCQARLSKINHEGTDKNTSWPRIRILVFQAYVGRLGSLGADLSRQVASIYGMASDYASFYNTTEARSEGASKRQALEALIQHIEEVTPRLAQVETTGKLPKAPKPVSFTSVLPAPKKHLSLAAQEQHQAHSAQTSSGNVTPKTPGSPPDGGSRQPRRASTEPTEVELTLAKAKDEIVTDAAKSRAAQQQKEVKTAPAKAAVAQKAATAQTTAKPNKKPSDLGAAAAPAAENRAAALAAKFVTRTPAAKPAPAASPVKAGGMKIYEAAQTALRSVAAINFKAPIFERLTNSKSLHPNKQRGLMLRPKRSLCPTSRTIRSLIMQI